MSASFSDPLPCLRTLLCHRDVALAIHCLSTALRLSADPVQLVIHEDGSLTEEDRQQLAQHLPGSRIIDRHEADQRMAERLSAHSHAAAFRASSVWGLKLLDIVLAEPGFCFYIDADIRFFRPFSGLFTSQATHERCVFLRDTVWQAYSIRPWHLLPSRDGLSVASGINSGLTLCDPSVFDLDFIDWFLSHTNWRVIPAWTEPTCWAALAIRANGYAVHPAQLVNLYPSANITSHCIGAHFLSAYRFCYQDLLSQPILNHSVPPVQFRFQKLKPLSSASLALSQFKRKIQNTQFFPWAP
jgi:hypothetical protein